jgi:hypothetical protein
MQSHRSSMARRFAACFGVMALLVRCVIAPGLMPDPVAANGALRLVICTGSGLKWPVKADNSGGNAPRQGKGEASLCPFAAIGAAAIAVTDPPALGAPGFEPVLVTGLAHEIPRPALSPVIAARAPPQRG